MQKIKNSGGYITIIIILIITIIGVIWMLRLWKMQWIGGINGSASKEVPELEGKLENKNAVEQLDMLRGQMKNITDKKDKEINDALKDTGKTAENIIDK
jgi:hypothetical protein